VGPPPNLTGFPASGHVSFVTVAGNEALQPGPAPGESLTGGSDHVASMQQVRLQRETCALLNLARYRR
jgi:hypothetical protein